MIAELPHGDHLEACHIAGVGHHYDAEDSEREEEHHVVGGIKLRTSHFLRESRSNVEEHAGGLTEQSDCRVGRESVARADAATESEHEDNVVQHKLLISCGLLDDEKCYSHEVDNRKAGGEEHHSGELFSRHQLALPAGEPAVVRPVGVGHRVRPVGAAGLPSNKQVDWK